jgi:hypothetical protein
MKYFTSSLLFALTIVSGGSFAQSPSPAESNEGVLASAASDTVDVQHVIDAYHEAVLTHNGSRLEHLFIPQGSVWLNVLSDEAYARAKAKSPDAVKIRVGSYTDFAKLVSTSVGGQKWKEKSMQAEIRDNKSMKEGSSRMNRRKP